MNTDNSKTNESHRFRLSLVDKLDLKHPNKNIALSNLSIYYSWKNIKSAYNNNKFKTEWCFWFAWWFLFDWWYSGLSWIYHHKHETLTESSPVEIYPNKIKNRIVFKIKTGYRLELLSPETMKLLGSTKKDVDQDKNREDVRKLESVEVVLVHCNVVNNNYQQVSKVLLTFVPNK